MKYVSGDVLDYERNSFMEYFGAKTLLKNGAKNILRCTEINQKRTYSCRTFGETNSIAYSKIDYTKLIDKKFFCITAFESFQPTEYFINIINEFGKQLSSNGILIFSCVNKEFYTTHTNLGSTGKIYGLTKEEILEILQDRFEKIELFSQKLLTRNEIKQIKCSDLYLFLEDIPLTIPQEKKLFKTRVRKLLARISLWLDPTSTFYKINIQKKLSILSAYTYKTTDNDYIPIPYNENHIPLFFVVKCNKKFSFD